MLATDDGEAENEDRLLAEAGTVVREHGRASVSLLQRRLSIGYSRAARLLDQLEERGIVGPSEDGRSHLVLDPENDRAERDQAQQRAGRADPEGDAAWEQATRAEAERDEAQAQVRAHAERRGWLARLLQWWD
jgi:DNA segregation ATPase FtsK/SpoIIIE-like protein